MVVPTVGEVRRALDSADRPFQAFVGLCAFSGLRLAEASGVQVGDIDFLRRSLSVSRQVQWAAGSRLEVRAPKYCSERIVYLAPSLVDMLGQHLALHRPGHGPSDWLFTGDAEDLPAHPNTVSHRWRMTRKRAGIERFTLHDLRHF